eukprot:6110759-Pyramimonas_sp.AAC.1
MLDCQPQRLLRPRVPVLPALQQRGVGVFVQVAGRPHLLVQLLLKSLFFPIVGAALWCVCCCASESGWCRIDMRDA